MNNLLEELRQNPGNILAMGNYRPVYQAILDFDYLCGKDTPSIKGIVTASARFQKYFWGSSEVLIPCFSNPVEAADSLGDDVKWMLNINSARRALSSTREFFSAFPEAIGGHIFAEDIPETHAIALYDELGKKGKTIIGPAGVGLIVPGSLKLGAIGGVDGRQIEKNKLMNAGSVAVLSASGGMVNEIITMVAGSNHGISFGLCFGGDRFPVTRPRQAFEIAEQDSATSHIVYYGELGGQDEYEIAHMLRDKQITKPVICYIAGVIGESFDQPVQFGHAKALARTKDETASAKRTALQEAGAQVANSMQEFEAMVQQIPPSDINTPIKQLGSANRSASLFTSTISHEDAEGYAFAGKLLQDWAQEGDLAKQITTGLLGASPKSGITVDFIRTSMQLLVDHGPQVSGAVNTIVTARAGKGVVDSLAAGLLTIGPRFGGAVSDAAREWFDGVQSNRSAAEHVETRAKAKKYIGGIGHKKYRLGLPDPRVELLMDFAEKLPKHPHLDYARSIEAITSAKKGSLILNVDGTIAAILLDILANEEKLSHKEINLLISADFFNSLFVLARTIGFVSHYLDQKRIDEGLFRLPDKDIFLA